MIVSCFADVIIRPGFFQQLLQNVQLKKQAYVPVLWSTCYNKGLETIPNTTKYRSNENGCVRMDWLRAADRCPARQRTEPPGLKFCSHCFSG